MLTQSERQEMCDLLRIAENLMPGIMINTAGSGYLMIFGEDTAKWVLERICALRTKDMMYDYPLRGNSPFQITVT